MEIPNINRHETSQEKEPSIDFLNEKLKMFITIEQEAVDNLPVITDQDFSEQTEKYHVLLGDFSRNQSNEITVHITQTMFLEHDFKNRDLFYTEHNKEVRPYLANIQKLISSLQDEYSKDNVANFIGDIHTHPIMPEDSVDGDPCHWSDEDVRNVISNYTNGTLSSNKPFVFGIAGRINNRMSYAFYRLVKHNDEYFVEKLQSLQS